MDIAKARLDALPVRDIEKVKLVWGIRTFGINRCISNHVTNHRIHAMGIVALRRKIQRSIHKCSGTRLVDMTMRHDQRQLKSYRRQMLENKLIIRFLLSLRQLRPKRIVDDNLNAKFKIIVGGRTD